MCDAKCDKDGLIDHAARVLASPAVGPELSQSQGRNVASRLSFLKVAGRR